MMPVIFEDLGMDRVFEERALADLKVCKELLKSEGEIDILRNMRQKPKLRTYCKDKMDCDTEAYLMGYLSKTKRSFVNLTTSY